MNLKKYFCYWFKTAELSFAVLNSTRLASLLFITGKLIRFLFLIWFLILLEEKLERVAGYSLHQLLLFFLVFNFFDTFGQMFFRGIYWFRSEVVSGNFDFNLLKPISPLFQIMTKHTDFLDVPLFLIIIVYLARSVLGDPTLTLQNIILFCLLGICSLILITSFHIIVAALGVITTEVDHSIMIYRDLSTMARFPIDIYTAFLRAILTYVIPIAVIFTFPAKALLALLSPVSIVYSIFVSLLFFFFAYKFWQYALTQYSSASS